MPSSIVSPFPVFNDLDGTPLEAGYIYIGTANLNPETSPINVFWDAALTVPAAQPIRTIGGFPSRNGSPGNLYVSPSSFSITVRNRNQVFVFSSLSAGGSGGGAIFQGYPITRDQLSLPLLGTDSSFVQSGTSAVTQTMQAKARQLVSVKDFGAIGDGIVDDTAAIQAALDSLSASHGIVHIPSGLYKISSINVPEGVTLQGDGPYPSFLRSSSAAGETITLNVSSNLIGVSVSSDVIKTSGFSVNVLGNGCIIDNCAFDKYFIAINVGTESTVVVNPIISRCVFRTPSTALGTGAVQFINFSNAQMSDCVLTAYDLPAVQPSFGIRFQNGDTAFLSNTNVTTHGKALLVDPPSLKGCYALSISNCIFDSSGEIAGGAQVSCAEFTPAGAVCDTKISNSWFGLSRYKSGCYVAPSGAGFVDGITFTGCEFPENHESGLLCVGTGTKNWVVTGGMSCANLDAGIRAATGTSYFTIIGHRAGNVATRGANGTGIKIDNAASDNYIIADNNVIGNTSFAILDQGTGTNARVTENLGYNGASVLSGLTVTASPFSYTAGHTPETIYVIGGTVSDIKVDSQTVQNSTGSTILLVPNQTMQITYSSAPSVLCKKN